MCRDVVVHLMVFFFFKFIWWIVRHLHISVFHTIYYSAFLKHDLVIQYILSISKEILTLFYRAILSSA